MSRTEWIPPSFFLKCELCICSELRLKNSSDLTDHLHGFHKIENEVVIQRVIQKESIRKRLEVQALIARFHGQLMINEIQNKINEDHVTQ